MPLFRIQITLTTGKYYCVFRNVPGIDLDAYYLEMHSKAVKTFGTSMLTFNCEQISIHSPTAAMVMERERNKPSGLHVPVYQRKPER